MKSNNSFSAGAYQFRRCLIKSTQLVAMVCVASVVTGCASSGKVRHATMQAGVNLKAYESVALETSAEPANCETERKTLHALIASRLQESGKLKRVSGASGAVAQIKVNARIRKMNKVSDGSRIMFGALAGQAQIVVDVEVIDVASGSKLNSFQAVGTSSGGWIGAGTSDQAIRLVADQIANQLVGTE